MNEVEKFEATDEILAPLQAKLEELLTGSLFQVNDHLKAIKDQVINYFNVSDQVIENLSDMSREENHYSSVERLTSLQAELGYKEGELSTVAMLGLVGEAGEVLEETRFKHDGYGEEGALWKKKQTLMYTRQLEGLKKSVRNGDSAICIIVLDSELSNFKAELADCIYYANILATNVGLTLFDLCQMAHDKIKRKQAEGGSSEDRKS